MTVLVIADHNNASLGAATLNAVTAGAKLGDVHVLVAGKDAGAAAEAAAKVQGVAKVLHAEGDQYQGGLPENLAPLIVGLAGDYSHIVASSSSVAKNVLPRVAALLDVAQISDAIEIVSEDTFVRPIYAGNALATVQSSDKVKVLTIRGTAFKAAEAEGGSAAVGTIAAGEDAGLSRFVGRSG